MSETHEKPQISEDWLAVLIAFILIALATAGVLGKHGINLLF